MLCEWAYRFSSATLACERPWKSRERSSDPGPHADPPVAAARRHKSAPTLSEIETVLSAMPASTDLERRDRAIVAFTILTGARDRAIVPFKLKHVDLKRRMLNQDAREVHTKRAKTFVSWFFPVGDHIERIVTDWIGFLGNEKCFGLDDPLFPKTKVEARMEAGFQASGLAREHWANASPIRAIFKGAFSRAGLPYRNPHSFRNTLVQVAYDPQPRSRSIQGMLPEFGTRELPHNVLELRHNSGEPASRTPPFAREFERGRLPFWP
jgi:integrase